MASAAWALMGEKSAPPSATAFLSMLQPSEFCLTPISFHGGVDLGEKTPQQLAAKAEAELARILREKKPNGCRGQWEGKPKGLAPKADLVNKR